MKKSLILFIVLLWCASISTPGSAQAFDSLHLLQPNASLKEITHQFIFTEGPAVDQQGNIFFTDQPNDKIWEYGINGKLQLYMDKTGRANGLYFNKEQQLIACADEHNELWQVDAQKKITVLLDNIQGHKMNGPNDLWIDGKDGIYFTDPYYQRDYWQRKQPDITAQKVYYLPKGKKEAVEVEGGLKKPNGIVGTPDGKYLYVADIGSNKTYKYDINTDGSLHNRQLFTAQGSDGMTLDNNGNLYLTGNGVTVYNNKGIKIAYIPVPAPWTGNICFGGKDRHTLFITASTAIYILPMTVKGVE